jgi:cell division protein FtsN
MVPAEERPPENRIYGIDPNDIIPEIIPTTPDPEPVREPERTHIVTDPTFSVPRITELQRGRYYVQLAAYPTAEAAENGIKQIERDIRSYSPVVFRDGDNWYRVLLGDFNQGESAAVLQRFRSIGYRDAFVTDHNIMQRKIGRSRR